jgi:uncharacterized protein YkwD
VRASLALLALGAALGGFAVPAPAATVSARDAVEARLVHRLNAVRERRGLPTLRVRAILSRAAARHAASMAGAGYFSHSLYTRRTRAWTPFDRWIRWYYGASSAWSAGREPRLGAPDLGPRRTVRLWLASPPHRTNLLDRRWREVGVADVQVRRPGGYFAAWDDVTIVVADFGRRS